MTVKARHERFETYEVFDEDGNPVGRVVLPRRPHFLGRREGTVLLSRQPRLRRGAAPRAA